MIQRLKKTILLTVKGPAQQTSPLPRPKPPPHPTKKVSRLSLKQMCIMVMDHLELRWTWLKTELRGINNSFRERKQGA